jgi:hypothetical protein
VWHLLHFRPLSHLSQLTINENEYALPDAFNQAFAVLGLVPEQLGGPSEVSQVMSEYATLAIV